MRSLRTPRGVAPAADVSRRRLTAVLALACVVAAFALLVSRADAAESPAPAHGAWPLRPRPPVVAGFDPPSTRFGSGHRGVDLAGASGSGGPHRARRHGDASPGGWPAAASSS